MTVLPITTAPFPTFYPVTITSPDVIFFPVTIT